MFKKIKVGLVSFTENRDVDLVDETVKYENEQHRALVKYLKDSGFEVIDPMATRADNVGINNIKDVNFAIDNLKINKADCVVIGAWKWTEIMLALN